MATAMEFNYHVEQIGQKARQARSVVERAKAEMASPSTIAETLMPALDELRGAIGRAMATSSAFTELQHFVTAVGQTLQHFADQHQQAVEGQTDAGLPTSVQTPPGGGTGDSDQPGRFPADDLRAGMGQDTGAGRPTSDQ